MTCAVRCLARRRRRKFSATSPASDFMTMLSHLADSRLISPGARRARPRLPTRPRRPRSATAVSAGANLQGSVRYNVERLQLAPASTERPQTKMGGISVAKRACGRLINKTAPLFSRLSPQRSFMRRKALAFVLRAAEENFEQRANWLICGRFVCVWVKRTFCARLHGWRPA